MANKNDRTVVAYYHNEDSGQVCSRRVEGVG